MSHVMALILAQVLPSGQHRIVVAPASTRHVEPVSQQKLSGSPDCVHLVKLSAAHVSSALESNALGRMKEAETVAASTAARRKALAGPQRYGIGRY